MVSFVSYVLLFKNEYSAIGDIARDIEQDKKINKRFGYKRLVSYLLDINACNNALIAVDDAYEGYKILRQGPHHDILQ
jgi:hypothetical protein